MLLASQMGQTAGRARKCIQLSAKAKSVTEAEGKGGDAGAVFDLAPKVGPVSDQ